MRLARSLRLSGGAALAALVLLACRGGAGSDLRAPGAPVVVISVDTLRADHLPAWGYGAVSTPHLDQLARDGLLFEQAWAQVPLTFPSHASLLSGLLPPEAGVRSNIGATFDAARHETLPQALQKKGYATGAAVSAYVLRATTGLGAAFDFYDDSMEVWEAAALGNLQRPGRETIDVARRWIDQQAAGPFFLFVHLFEPHTPYEPPEPFRSRYANPYDGEIAASDALVGELLDHLRDRRLYDRALIVFLSDHGEGLGEHGEDEHGILLYRETLHVPLIVKLPGNRRAGERVSAPAQLVDLFPTVAEIVGAPVPQGLPGASLLRLGRDPALADRHLYSETMYPRIHLGWSELRSLIDSRFQYIAGPDPELYDLRADPAETRNLRDSEVRVFRARRAELEAMPLRLEAATSVDAEEAAKLAALGYLSAVAAPSDQPRLDPKRHIQALARIRETFVLNAEGKYEETVALCREVLRQYPTIIDVRNQLAATLRRLGRFEEALATYKEALQLNPALLDVMAIEIGKVELDLGNLPAVELNARHALRANPLEAHLLLAAVAMQRREWAKAEAEARAALGPADRPRVPALIWLARAQIEQGHLDEALASAERAAQRVASGQAQPVQTLASTLGDVLARMGRNAEAEAAFRREIATFPQTLEAYARLAVLYAAEHRFAEIEPTLDEMVAANPRRRAFLLAAETMQELGNRAGAEAYRRRAP